MIVLNLLNAYLANQTSWRDEVPTIMNNEIIKFSQRRNI